MAVYNDYDDEITGKLHSYNHIDSWNCKCKHV